MDKLTKRQHEMLQLVQHFNDALDFEPTKPTVIDELVRMHPGTTRGTIDMWRRHLTNLINDGLLARTKRGLEITDKGREATIE